MPSTSASSPPAARPGAAGGDRLLGMPKPVAILVIVGGVAVVYLLYSSHKSSSQTGQGQGSTHRGFPKIVVVRPGGRWHRRGGHG